MIDGVKNQVIGLCGYAGVGKDTVYLQMIKQFRQLNPQRVAFADPLKHDLKGCEEALSKICHVNMTLPENKEKFRDMWVWWSRVAKRFDPLIWVRRANPVIHELQKRGWVFVTDVRYDFEIETLRREKKALILRLGRPTFKPRNDEEEMSFKVIEEKFPELCPGGEFYIDNDSTKDALGEKVKALICKHFNIELTIGTCAGCGKVTDDYIQSCSTCGKTFCRDCITLDLSKGVRLCDNCKGA